MSFLNTLLQIPAKHRRLTSKEITQLQGSLDTAVEQLSKKIQIFSAHCGDHFATAEKLTGTQNRNNRLTELYCAYQYIRFINVFENIRRRCYLMETQLRIAEETNQLIPVMGDLCTKTDSYMNRSSSEDADNTKKLTDLLHKFMDASEETSAEMLDFDAGGLLKEMDMEEMLPTPDKVETDESGIINVISNALKHTTALDEHASTIGNTLETLTQDVVASAPNPPKDLPASREMEPA